MRLAAASALVVAGCATLRRGSELDDALANLQAALDEIADNESEQIQFSSLSRRIRIRAEDLVYEHQEFVESFNRLLSEREVSQEELLEKVASFIERREWLRNDLLRLQDELHYALTPAEWQDIVQVLNQNSNSVTIRALEGA